MVQGKTIIVTGAASGIGAATAAIVSSHGAEVISVDINRPATPVGRFVQADLSDRSSIDCLVAALPSGAHGLANIAGLPLTRSAEAVLKVNLVGLK
jgi:NAD(P)-dependent dehydrogenase (short-subunit alcohol dehydrogenase family)